MSIDTVLLDQILQSVAKSRGKIRRVYLSPAEYRAIKRAAGVGLHERDPFTSAERRVMLAGAMVYRLSEIGA